MMSKRRPNQRAKGATPRTKETISPATRRPRTKDAEPIPTTPLWIHVVSALLAGTACALSLYQQIPYLVAAFALLLIAAVIWQKFRERRSRITDGRAVLAHFVNYFALIWPTFVLPLVLGPNSPFTTKVLAGAGVAILFFAYLKIDEHYQVKRLREGDHGPYDIT